MTALLPRALLLRNLFSPWRKEVSLYSFAPSPFFRRRYTWVTPEEILGTFIELRDSAKKLVEPRVSVRAPKDLMENAIPV